MNDISEVNEVCAKPNVLCVSTDEMVFAIFKRDQMSNNFYKDWTERDVRKIEKKRNASKTACISITGFEMSKNYLVNIPITPDSVVQIVEQDDLEDASVPTEKKEEVKEAMYG